MVNSNAQQKPKKQRNERILIKVLVPGNVAGSIIGKGGEAIKQIKKTTNSVIRVSSRDEIFPFTDERIVLIISPAEKIMESISFVHSKIRNAKSEQIDTAKKSHPKWLMKRLEEMKIVVATSTAGGIIGKKGENVKKMQEKHKVKISLTSREDWGYVPGESVCTISGKEADVNSAIEEITQIIMADHRGKLSSSLSYPPYNMMDNFAYHGPPPIHRVSQSGHDPRGMKLGLPKYDGYQCDQIYPIHHPKPKFY